MEGGAGAGEARCASPGPPRRPQLPSGGGHAPQGLTHFAHTVSRSVGKPHLSTCARLMGQVNGARGRAWEDRRGGRWICRRPAGGTVICILCPLFEAPERQNWKRGISWELMAYLGGWTRSVVGGGREATQVPLGAFSRGSGTSVQLGNAWTAEKTRRNSRTEVLHPAPPVGRWPGLSPDALALGLPHSHTCLIAPPTSAAQPAGLSPGPPPWEALSGTPVPDPASSSPATGSPRGSCLCRTCRDALWSSFFSCFCSVFPMRV